MCTTTNAEATQPARDIRTLLGLGTYQGMTDDEIEAVVEYKIDAALASRESMARVTALIERAEQRIADNRASAEASLSMLQSIIESEFPTVPLMTPQIFEPRITEV